MPQDIRKRISIVKEGINRLRGGAATPPAKSKAPIAPVVGRVPTAAELLQRKQQLAKKTALPPKGRRRSELGGQRSRQK